MEIFNTILSFIALLAAFYSIWYTQHYNRYVLAIAEAFFYFEEEHLPPLIEFEIFNNSTKAILIKNIELLNSENQSIHHLVDFQPEIGREVIQEKETISLSHLGYSELTINPQMTIPKLYKYQAPFKRPTIIPANDAVSFSYYIYPLESDMIIKITADSKIQWFSKTKSFYVKFVQPD